MLAHLRLRRGCLCFEGEGVFTPESTVREEKNPLFWKRETQNYLGGEGNRIPSASLLRNRLPFLRLTTLAGVADEKPGLPVTELVVFALAYGSRSLTFRLSRLLQHVSA
ncbi:hypothetical protein TNCV_3963871 [Trichonephila clavipes]|nr:hypothetical protein TNCV_3963871 [Trichonephila clavipes]